MKKIICIALTILFTHANFILADVKATKQPLKLGSNILSLILLGDINGYIERQFNPYFSWVATSHYISTGKLNEKKTNIRTSLGLRTYTRYNFLNLDLFSKNILTKRHSLTGNFFEFKSGIIRIESSFNPTLEFSIGQTHMFNEKVYYEFKLGLIRVLNDNDVLPLGSFGVGFLY